MLTPKKAKQIECRDILVKSLIVISYLGTDSVTYCMRGTTKGRPRKKLGTSKTISLNQARIMALEVESTGYNVSSSTLSHVFKLYEQSGTYSGKRSMGRDRKRYDSVVAPLLGEREIKTISLADIQAVLASLRPSLSDATKNRYLAMLRSIFRFAVDHDYCEKDPTRSIKLKREVQVKLYEVNDDLIDHLVFAVGWLEERYPRTSCLVELLLRTGMRLGEALSLKWGDVDFTLQQITLRSTKSGRVRHVPISDECSGVLDRLAEITADFPKDGWLFPSSYGPSHMTRPVRPWKMACQAAGLPSSLRFHDLRHIFASACVKDGIPLYTVQGLLGHSSIRMTERYSALASSDLLKASCRVSSALSLRAGGAK
ncbi:tyrosine-type recombinase/integrase [Pseudomonas carnis]|uniref:Tyrosine-type recombinase/integrase n=1 Tax=Pseudomonas paracarnis TaxID=2750625 RepID=A0ABU6BS38_9PSED|nr:MULTISPECIES: site-specific integrase [Pseudomonas]MBH3371186.1 tyrosine-type recombinase/integrase [Pseudomonas carnis]MEB3782650.1 tyrosine-type recombinase/integrase [Pseudomonas paracarnis]